MIITIYQIMIMKPMILHKTVQDAQDTINKMNKLIIDNSYNIGASFARKLNKMYKVNITNIDTTTTTTKIKQFMNKYFNEHYNFDDEENKKNLIDMYPQRNKHNQNKIKLDVIQNIKIVSTINYCEFKKVDYALFQYKI